MQEFNPGARPAVPIAGRSGVSPIGTTSPNTGAAGNTGSSYASGAFASGVNIQGTATAYTVQDTDYQGLILFNTAAAVTVTLNYAVGDNFTTTILNIGSGKITLLPNYPPADPGSALYTVNGGVSLTLASGSGCVVAFADRLWYAYVGATFIPVVPSTFTPIAGEFLTGYNATTGAFSASAFPVVPNFADEEIPGGLIDGMNVTFTLANAPNPAASLLLSLNGMLQHQGIGFDYTLSGNTITMSLAPVVLSDLLAWYRH